MSTVQKDKDSLWTSSNQEYRKTKQWDTVHVELIDTYSNYIRQHQPCVDIVKNNVSLTCMTIIDPATGWFEIFDMPMFDLNEVTCSNDEYINKSSSRVI